MTNRDRSQPIRLRPPCAAERVSSAAVAGLVVLAVVVGLLLGGFAGSGDPPAAPTAAAPQPTVHDGLRLQIPRGWARGTVAGIRGFDRPLGLHNADAGLRALVERLPATSPTPLPAAFLGTLEDTPEAPEVVRLDSGQEAWALTASPAVTAR